MIVGGIVEIRFGSFLNQIFFWRSSLYQNNKLIENRNISYMDFKRSKNKTK